ncbi:MAG: hypothetical protein ABII71_03370 [Candidatus Micrarchaeota archaeon]
MKKIQRAKLRELLIHAKAAKKAAERDGLVRTSLCLGWFANKRVLSEWLRDADPRALIADIQACRGCAADDSKGKSPGPEGRFALVLGAFRRISPTLSRIDELSREGVDYNLKAMKELLQESSN